MKTIETTTTVSTKDFDFREALQKMADAKKQVKELNVQLESFSRQFTEIDRYKPKKNPSGKFDLLPVLKIPEGYEVERTACVKTIINYVSNVLWFVKKNAKGHAIDGITVILENLYTNAVDTEEIKAELPFDTDYLLYPGKIKFKVILGYVESCDESIEYTVEKDIDEKDVISALEKRYKKAE